MATLDEAIAAMTGETEATQGADPPDPAPEEEGTLVEGTLVDSEETAAEATEETEEEKLYAGKYKTTEDLERAYTELQSKLGAQGDELGKLRQLEEQFSQLQEQLSTQPTPNPFETAEWDNVNFENTQKVRQQALWLAQNDPFNYDSFLESWYEESPRAATAFEMDLKNYEWEQKFEDARAPVAEISNKLTAEERAQQTTATFEQVWANLGAQNPDLNDFAEKIIEEAGTTPAIAAVFRDGDAEQMSGALQILLNAARYRRSQATEIAAAQEAEAAGAAKSKANLTKATASAGSQSKTPTAGDRILEAFEKEARGRGWWSEPTQ